MAKENKINTVTLTTDLQTEPDKLFENESVTPVETKEKMFEVNIKEDFKAYLGDGWYYFKKGKNTVPAHVKAYLKQVNALLAI